MRCSVVRFPLREKWMNTTPQTGRPSYRTVEMTRFANNFGRIRVTEIVGDASGGHYVNVRRTRAFNPGRFSYPRDDDAVGQVFRPSVHRVSVGIAFTGSYPDGRWGFLCFERPLGGGHRVSEDG